MSYETEQQYRRNVIAMERVNEQEREIVEYKAIVQDAIRRLKNLRNEGWSPNAHYDVSDVIDILTEALPDDLDVISKRLESDIQSDMLGWGSV